LEIKLTRGEGCQLGIQLTCITPPHVRIVQSQDMDFQLHTSWSFCVQWVNVRGHCSFCWYSWNCWPLLSKLSFHNLTCLVLYSIYVNGSIDFEITKITHSIADFRKKFQWELQ